MDYKKILINRRSVRNYLEKQVPIETILEIIHESTYAPSSGNEQPWKFIIINDRIAMKNISEEAKSNILNWIESNPNDNVKKYETLLKNKEYNIFYNASTVVLIIGDTNLKNTKVNCALAGSYFMMSATSRNLGTCWINFATHIKSKDMIKQLGIPENHEIVAPIIIGYPAEVPTIPLRKEPEIIRII